MENNSLLLLFLKLRVDDGFKVVKGKKTCIGETDSTYNKLLLGDRIHLTFRHTLIKIVGVVVKKNEESQRVEQFSSVKKIQEFFNVVMQLDSYYRGLPAYAHTDFG